MGEGSSTFDARSGVSNRSPGKIDPLDRYRALLEPARLIEAKKKCDMHPFKTFVTPKDVRDVAYFCVGPCGLFTALFMLNTEPARFVPVAKVTDDGLLEELPKET